MFDKFHKAILRKLYSSGVINERHTPRENATKGFPKSDIGGAKEALKELIKWDYIKIKKTSHGEDVYLNIHLLKDIEKILETDLPFIPNYKKEQDSPPVESYLNEGYDRDPFYSTTASHNIHGREPSTYLYHKNSDSDILVLVNGKGQTPYKINLGSFSNPRSLLSKALTQIDKKFGNNEFKRAELNDLDRDIVGNKQNLKAVLDMMLYWDYLREIKKGKTYQRSAKSPPRNKMDDY